MRDQSRGRRNARHPFLLLLTSTYNIKLKLHYFFVQNDILKNIYLIHTSSVLNTDCTVVVYVMRRSKLDLTCIYFDNILHR